MPIHCDTIIDDASYPECIRNYLRYNRLPAVCKQAGEVRNEQWVEKDLIQYIWTDPEPNCYADYNGKRVRLVMASRFGDVGITEQLDERHGYDRRVFVLTCLTSVISHENLCLDYNRLRRESYQITFEVLPMQDA